MPRCSILLRPAQHDLEYTIQQRSLQRRRLIPWRPSRLLRNWLLVTVTIYILGRHVRQRICENSLVTRPVGGLFQEERPNV